MEDKNKKEIIEDIEIFEMEPSSEELKQLEQISVDDDISDVIEIDDELENLLEIEESDVESIKSNARMASSSMNMVFEKTRNFKLLTREEEIRLFKKLREENDQNAFDIIFYSNIKLVRQLASKYRREKISVDDLFQEGCIGLKKAIERFDYELGYKFSTYASWWIRQAIRRSIADKGSVIRIPVHMKEYMNKIRSAIEILKNDSYREPTSAEIAEYTGFSVERVESILYFKENSNTVSLNTKINGEEDTELGDMICDENVEAGTNIIENIVLKDAVERCLSILTEREREIITLRFGLDGEGEKTLEFIGQKYGLTRERIRQIEMKGLRKIRVRVEYNSNVYNKDNNQFESDIYESDERIPYQKIMKNKQK